MQVVHQNTSKSKWEFCYEYNRVHVIPGFEELSQGMDDLENSRWMTSELIMYRNYLQYLSDARNIISTSVQACQVWSAPYDGLKPSPEDYQEDEEQKDGDRDQEDVCPPLTTPRLQPPTPHHSSLSRTLELEWDDSYDAAPDREENQSFHFIEHVQPPKHIQDMRKSAIMLIRGSYVEESEFQDDVLVYNLIAQRDAQDDRMMSFKNAPKCQNDKMIQIETNNNTHFHTNCSTQKDNMENIQNQESEEASLLLNIHIDDVKTDKSNDKSAHVIQNQSIVLEAQHQNMSKNSIVKCTGEDFISQCLQLIDWDKESMLGDNVYFQRLTTLLYGKETEMDFNLICTDDEDDERNKKTQQRHSDGKKHVPFTGERFFICFF